MRTLDQQTIYCSDLPILRRIPEKVDVSRLTKRVSSPIEIFCNMKMALFFEINQKMYSHFDPDNDDSLDIDEMNAEFHKIDKNADGLLEKPEFEHYYTTVGILVPWLQFSVYVCMPL
ncbi:hypothetical protein DPMN_183894 [Dreissena polymorpha]|uniref:EF-hand domain-containing protein n=1 Tax=Dreissena polymorpha TaxID=45954 RepID=A0A9D4I7D8_DREPO|nr:hypothetical protein DPMN_183894 [Dreissena polymorpha]